MESLQAVEQWDLVRQLKTSFVAYPVVNAVHIAAIGALLTSVALLDLRILGAFGSLPERAFVMLLRRLTLMAFCLAVLSGLALFSVRASHYAGMPVFLGKMGLIALAGANFALFVAIESDKQHPWPSLRRLLAVMSVVIWCAVLLCGRFIGFL